MVSSAGQPKFRGPLMMERAVGTTAAATLQRLLEIDTAGFDTEALADHALEVVRCTDRLRTVSARMMAYADVNAASLTKGAHTMSGLVNTECGISRRNGSALNLVGTAPDRYPHFYRFLLEGRIGPGHIEVLQPVWAKVDKHHFAACEQALVELAEQCTPEEFADHLAEWRNLVDEDASLDDFIRGQGQQHFQYGFDLFGAAHYSGTVGPEHAEPFIETIEQNTNPHSTHVRPSQARGDAIVELVLNPDGKYRAHLEVIVPDNTTNTGPLNPDARAQWAVPVHGDTGFGPIRTPRTARGTSIPPAIVARMKADGARIRTHPVDSYGTITTDRPGGRHFGEVQKRLIRLRDHHCQHPGCRQPARRCHYDHVEPHHHDGPTLIRNGQLLCPFHHRFKHKDDPGPNRPTIFDNKPTTIQLE